MQNALVNKLDISHNEISSLKKSLSETTKSAQDRENRQYETVRGLEGKITETEKKLATAIENMKKQNDNQKLETEIENIIKSLQSLGKISASMEKMEAIQKGFAITLASAKGNGTSSKILQELHEKNNELENQMNAWKSKSAKRENEIQRLKTELERLTRELREKRRNNGNPLPFAPPDKSGTEKPTPRDSVVEKTSSNELRRIVKAPKRTLIYSLPPIGFQGPKGF